MIRWGYVQPSQKERAIGVVHCKNEGKFLQTLSCHCVESAIHHERDANNSGRNVYLNKIRFSYLHYILQYNFWVGFQSEQLKSLYWYLKKTQSNGISPTAKITMRKYYIKPR